MSKYCTVIRFFIAATLTVMSCSATFCPAQNKIDQQGRRQGHWIKTDKDGSRIFEGDFKDGLEVGTFNYYYPDGTLKIRNIYTVPGRFCQHEAYDEKGHLLAKGFYNQKNRDSIWTIYNEQGRVVKIAGYKMGVKQGAHIVFNANGDTAEIATWNDNHRHGRWWKRIGKHGYITGTYINGIMQGRLTEYGDDGKLLRDGNYKDGLKDGNYRHFEGGILTVDERWQNGALTEREILLHAPNDRWISVHSIAYIVPKGNGATVYLTDGSRLACSDSPDLISQRTGDEFFVILDRKQRIMANTSCIAGIANDADGRAILDLQPKPPFTIFPDEECLRMVRSIKRIDELDEQ